MGKTKTTNIIGVLLAGGQSRRMFSSDATSGGDKGLIEVGGKPMIGHVIARLRPQVAQMVINANGDPTRFAQFQLPVTKDTIEGFVGPLAGVLSGMRWAHQNAPDATHILTAPTDAPLLPTDLRTRLHGALLANDSNAADRIAIAASGGNNHPVVGLWPVDLADDLEGALRAGVRKVRQWTDRHGTCIVPFPFINRDGAQIDPFFNANTQEDLEQVRLLIESST